jgi:hypothetical protein
MLTIYQAASRVVVWLGLADKDGNPAMEAIRVLSTKDGRSEITQQEHAPACLENLAKLITAFETFLQRPWFFRSWIRQEISAARTVIIRCLPLLAICAVCGIITRVAFLTC